VKNKSRNKKNIIRSIHMEKQYNEIIQCFRSGQMEVNELLERMEEDDNFAKYVFKSVVEGNRNGQT
jgi:hypothetical protein